MMCYNKFNLIKIYPKIFGGTMNRLVLMIVRNFWRAPWAYLKLCHYAKHTEEYDEVTKYRHVQYIFNKMIPAGNVDFKVYGLENIPEKSGFMLYANHQGLFDIPAIVSTCHHPIGVVLKKELANVPFVKQIAAVSFSYPMDRDNIRQSMKVMNDVANEVKKGRNYLIYPEGKRSRMGNKMLEFHSGSFKCVLKTKCPVLPIALIDTYKILDEKGSKPTEAQIHYLPVITCDEYEGLSSKELAELVHSRIEAKISEVTADRE